MNDVVMIQLDRPRELRFTYSALKTLCALTGKTIEELDQNIDPTNFELFEKLVHCGLQYDAKKNGETLTIEQIPELLDEVPTFVGVVEKVREAWFATFGQSTAVAQAAEGNPEAPADTSPAKADSTSTNPSE